MNNYSEQENILLGVNNLKGLIVALRKELPNILQPLNSIQEHLNQIFDIEGNYSLDLNIDEKEILIRAVDGLIDNYDKWEKLNDEFGTLIADVENWRDSIDIEDECAIDLAYSCIEDLENIQSKLDTTEIDFDEYNNCIDAIDDVLVEVLNLLEEFAI